MGSKGRALRGAEQGRGGVHGQRAHAAPRLVPCIHGCGLSAARAAHAARPQRSVAQQAPTCQHAVHAEDQLAQRVRVGGATQTIRRDQQRLCGRAARRRVPQGKAAAGQRAWHRGPGQCRAGWRRTTPSCSAGLPVGTPPGPCAPQPLTGSRPGPAAAATAAAPGCRQRCRRRRPRQGRAGRAYRCGRRQALPQSAAVRRQGGAAEP